MTVLSHIDILSVFDERDQPVDDNDTMNIAYGIDKNYAVGCGISIASVLINNCANFTFHVFSDEFDHEFIEKIDLLAKKFSTKIILYIITAEQIKTLPCNEIWSHAMYFRLLAFSHLSDKVSRILYLDADVMCKGELKKLEHIDLSSHVAAVVLDLPEMQEKSATRLKMSELNGSYFNSGVLLVNLTEWNRNNLTKEIFDKLINDSKFIQYPDQDVLNILLFGKVIFLPRDYNTIYTLKSELKDKKHQNYKHTITDSTILIHYTGITKPWHRWANYPSASYFQKALGESPWSKDNLKDADTLVEMKKKYKHLLKRGKIISGIISSLEYSIKKHISKRK